MSQKTRVVLKTKFESGRTPTEKDFSDVIDSGMNKLDDQIVVRHVDGDNEDAKYIGLGSSDPESPLSLKNRSGGANLLGFENQGGEEKWRVEVDPDGAGEGLNFTSKNDRSSNLFIQSGGKVGIGTKKTSERLTVAGTVQAKAFKGEMHWDNLAGVPLEDFIPQGGIIMWSGSIDKIPESWLLCNGENGTPNLLDRFVVGAGSSKYAVNDEGGLEDVKLTVDQMPSHNHSNGTLKATGGGGSSASIRGATGGDDNNHTNTHAFAGGDKHGGHTNFNYGITFPTHEHNVSGSTSNSGSSQSHENRPPYYALCFIMKT